MIISVKIPQKYLPERRYVAHVIFDVFFGIDYKIEIENRNSYELSFGDKRILFPDCFWTMDDNHSYLVREYLPTPELVSNRYCLEANIPCLYGDGSFFENKDTITCGIDVFASIFFMLTRWEEYVNITRDQHNRFPGKESIAYKYGFLHRPIVNEYMEMIWSMLQKIGYEGKRKKRKFELLPTHDIDHFAMEQRIIVSFRKICGDLLKRHSIQMLIDHVKLLFHDPYNIYSWLMDVSEHSGISSHFYMMSSAPGIKSAQDAPYIKTKRFRKQVDNFKKRGHFVGFHPGYFTYNNLEEFCKEKLLLESIINKVVVESRQHFLMMSIPMTLSMIDKQGIKIDSSLGYADMEGFRCGTGDEFPIFDFVQRKQLGLIERPLVVMDGTLINYNHYSIEQIYVTMRYYVSIGKKYTMPITILFHNSSFVGLLRKELKKMYKTIISE